MPAEGVGEGIGTSQDMHILAPPFSLRIREEYDDVLGWSRISSYSGVVQNMMIFWTTTVFSRNSRRITPILG